MELSFAQQSSAFGWSLLLGAMLSVLYGLMKFCRFTFSLGRAATVALDIGFMLIWALSLFYFCLGFLWGCVRVHVVFGSLLGFLLCRLTVGRISFLLYRPVVGFFKAVLQKIRGKLKIFAKYLLKIAYKLLYNIRSKIESFKKNHAESKKRKANRIETAKKKAGGSRARDSGARRAERAEKDLKEAREKA